MSPNYVPTESAAIEFIHEHAPICTKCGEEIAKPDDAERVFGRFRLQHKRECPNRQAER